MPDSTELKIASRESVALDLAMDIAKKENLKQKPDEYRSKLLDLYKECLTATKGNR
ncbi:hypothetical protein Sps_05146 [Shewanella psychrophila]|uniref:Uncharacterized protein n=1 Tax=Shewanella psychrophila TaxID=225848 RepID=A0A1S6HXD3_9GAMM|nr:hypothetical protein [Shewanella psychrophila]AQS40215.1 hypothetical protein Sps_05146 [Shewanella psychrophila]